MKNKSNIDLVKYEGFFTDIETVCIRVTGDDATDFLQGQLTNDVRKLSNGEYQISSYLTNQGKVIAIFRIFKDKDEYILLINKKISEYFINKISNFILRSKVLFNYDENIYVTIVKTKRIFDHFADLDLNKKNKCIKLVNKNIWILNYRDNLLFVHGQEHTNEIKELMSNLSINENNNNLFKLADNLNKFLRVDESNKEKYIPQVLRIDEMNGVDFKKGCYTGQEIVARTHYLGKIKKKIYSIYYKNKSISTFSKVCNKDGEDVGDIIGEEIKINEIYYNLAILKIESIETEKLFSDNININILLS